MKKGLTKGIAVFLIILIATQSKSIAQLTADDSLFYKKAKENTVLFYQQQLGSQRGLFNGSQYPGYPYSFAKGHPYFYNDTSNNGSIVYDNVPYENIQLLYNEVLDLVVLNQNSRSIQLISEKISRFTILNHLFIRLVKDSLSPSVPKSGFYELLYAGNTSVFKKETKKINEEVKGLSTELLRNIETTTTYYIKKNNIYYPVKSKSSIVNIYQDKKNEMESYIRNNKLKYKKDKENMLVKTTAYYDQLIK